MNHLNPFCKLAVRTLASHFLALFLLAGLLAAVTPLRAANPPTFLFEIDYSAVHGAADEIASVALDSSNNIYLTDNEDSRVIKIARDGTFLTQWGSSGSGNGQFGLDSPYGIAVDSSNNVYAIDGAHARVEKFDRNGNFLAQLGSSGSGPGQFVSPFGIAMDRSNNVYVTDDENEVVDEFDSHGNYLTQIAAFEQPATPTGIAVDNNNNVYVADSSDSYVLKFDGNGNGLTRWGSAGSGNGQFGYPYALAADPNSNVYVTDPGNYRVEKFTSNGAYLTQWGSVGSGNGQFFNPAGIAVDSTGNLIYVADQSRIEVFANNPNIVPPIITSQPVNQIVPAGVNVTFGFSVVGGKPFAYQWTSNSVAVPGATNPIFTLTNVSLAASDSTYSVLVTNNFGTALSSNAVLTVVPAPVTTLPASSISATGAVLNGSVTLGSDVTVVWFDWGTDTNYGNITDATIVPGNNGSNNISSTLSGLPGNFYYYRLDAANDFGIVYGNDEAFTVGSAPIAMTQIAAVSTNGSTLNATVNPSGWDTTVYFLWGNSALNNSTPQIDLGAGAASLNVSSFVTGLGASTPFRFQIVASNYLGTVSGAVAYWDPPFVSDSGAAGVVFTSLYSFTGTNDGANPYAGLIQGSDGYLYGTTENGGTYAEEYVTGKGALARTNIFHGDGTVFRISTNGALTTLYTFGFGDITNYDMSPKGGAYPAAGLVQGSDGYLYGTTEGNSYDSDYGTVFKISTNGVLTNLYSFGTIADYYGDPLDGANPEAGLVQGIDGNFYGTTSSDDGSDSGTVFKITTNGVLTSLHSFDGGVRGGTEGYDLQGALAQGTDGNFYGTTREGSTNYYDEYTPTFGTIFQITTNGTLTTLYSFNSYASAHPVAGLVQGIDGNFYGTTFGQPGLSTIFKISTNAAFSLLYSFTNVNDGFHPSAGLVQGGDGSLYGTTEDGGTSGSGTIFKINPDGTGFTTLYSFSAASFDPNNANYSTTNSDGAYPVAGLILVGNTLYGTAAYGGASGVGTVFSLTLPGPQLAITVSGANVMLSWPTNATGFTLESVTNLVPPVVWQTNSATPIVIGGQDIVTNPITSSQMFFRLTQ
jgi:uncharacterized repeat protein (TIGR03803 family)